MKPSSIKFNDNKLVIMGRKAPLIISIVLVLILAVCALVPLISTYFMMANGEGLKLGVFITFLVFGIPGFFVLRIFLWNTFGREHLYFDRNEIRYEADYGLFKDGRRSIDASQLILEFKVLGNSNIKAGTLLLSNPEESIQTILPITQSVFEDIKNYYNRHQVKKGV